jgi:hypothetical protein
MDVLIGQPEWSVRDDRFGMEQAVKIEVMVQARDLLDKKMNPSEGDYFTYGDTVYEVVSFLNIGNIWGQEEYDSAYKLVGKQARPGEFQPPKIFPPRKSEGGAFEGDSGIQKEFEQQRGISVDSSGKPTGLFS